MSKEKYYLVAKNNDTNSIRVVDIFLKDIYEDVKDLKISNNTLEEIDMFTTFYKNKNILLLKLAKDGKIDSLNTDFVIMACNGEKIDYMEVLYLEDMLSSELYDIAYSKKVGLKYQRRIASILDYFINKMFSDRNFYKFIVYKYSDVLEKFSNYFVNCYTHKEMKVCMKKDGYWALSSYPLVRSIIDAINRYDRIKKQSSNDILLVAADYKRKRSDAFKSFSKSDLGKSLSKNDKIEIIIDALNNFNLDTLKFDGNAIKLNLEKFKCSSEFRVVLLHLDSKIKELLFYYVSYKMYHDNYDDESLEYKNILEILIGMLMVNKDLLDSTYSFILLYNKCMNDTKKRCGYEKRKDY